MSKKVELAVKEYPKVETPNITEGYIVSYLWYVVKETKRGLPIGKEYKKEF